MTHRVLCDNNITLWYTHLTYSRVFLLTVTRRPVSSQLHGQAEIDDDAYAVHFHQDIAAVQVPVGNRWLVQV